MVIVRKALKAETALLSTLKAAPISSTAPTISFFAYVRDLGLNPISPDLTGMSSKEQSVALREHRELIDDLRTDFYIEVAEGRIVEPDDAEPASKADIIDRMREHLPVDWVWNERPARELTLGMEIKTQGDKTAIYVVDYVSPAGVTIQLVSGTADTLPDRCIIAGKSTVFYRRQGGTTTDSGSPKRRRKRSGLDSAGRKPVALAQGKRRVKHKK